MNLINQIKQDAFKDEFQKIALSMGTMQSAASKLLKRSYKLPYAGKTKKDISRAIAMTEGIAKRQVKKLDMDYFYNRMKNLK